MKLKSPSFPVDFYYLVLTVITEICMALFTDKVVIESVYLVAANCEVLLLCGQLEIKPNHLSMFLEL